jgi:hypothetical protein
LRKQALDQNSWPESFGLGEKYMVHSSHDFDACFSFSVATGEAAPPPNPPMTLQEETHKAVKHAAETFRNKHQRALLGSASNSN